jgi:hypothetical protein
MQPMNENPYQSPKEQNQRAYKVIPGVGCLLAAAVPAGFICGGITCYSVGVAGEAANTEAGWTWGIPVAMIVAVLIPVLAYVVFRSRA